MLLTVKEMKLLCVFHKGTISSTLDLLREAENQQPEKMYLVQSLIEKLSNLKKGEPISIAFDQEE